MKQQSQKFLRKRKAMLVLPLIGLPFICIIFWLLGGGKGSNDINGEQEKIGLNTQLPDAQIKDAPGAGKLAFYEQSDKDSVRLQEALNNDPYRKNATAMEDDSSIGFDSYNESETQENSPQANETRINNKLKELYKGLNQPAFDNSATSSPPITESTSSQSSIDLDRLESMMTMMEQSGSDDPEMKQLDGMLNKILDIQHPTRVQDRIKEQSLKNKKSVYTVDIKVKKDPVELLRGSPIRQVSNDKDNVHSRSNAFYEWSEEVKTDLVDDGIQAVVQESRSLTSGATIKMRLLTSFYINGILIPVGHFIYGTCSISEDRLNISINSLRHQNTILPVSLIAYDMDGIAGIYMPGAINRDVAKNTADDAVQGLDLYSMDNSLPLQAANVGVNAAKSLLSKKAKLVKVTVKAGYKVLLRDNNQQ